MTTRLLRFLACTAVFGGTTVHAEPASQPAGMPKEPLVGQMPAFAAWTILYNYPELKPKEGQPAAPTAYDVRVSTRVTKTRSIYWEETEWRSGQKSERWIINGLEFKSRPGSSDLVPVTYGELGRGHFAYDDGDFDGLAWLSLEAFKGTTKFQRQDVYLFKEPAGERTRKALLTVDGQRPLFVSDGREEQIYTYHKNPEVLLTPPAAVKQVARQWQAGQQAARQPPSPP